MTDKERHERAGPVLEKLRRFLNGEPTEVRAGPIVVEVGPAGDRPGVMHPMCCVKHAAEELAKLALATAGDGGTLRITHTTLASFTVPAELAEELRMVLDEVTPLPEGPKYGE